MTKRARLTTEAVLDAIAFSDDDVDDPAESFMEGSDEEFSDLDDLDSDDDFDDEQPSVVDLPPGSSQSCPLSSTPSSQSPPSLSPPSSQPHPSSAVPSATSSTPAQWSSSLSPVTIHSPVGATVPIPDTPSKVFA